MPWALSDVLIPLAALLPLLYWMIILLGLWTLNVMAIFMMIVEFLRNVKEGQGVFKQLLTGHSRVYHTSLILGTEVIFEKLIFRQLPVAKNREAKAGERLVAGGVRPWHFLRKQWL